ncbi:MAG: glycosyltransferase [Burkholderiaceae bacterium]|nr:glycosyltransferase [Burkholderiaceae bacterium]MEB2317249.1 glycosyltransferase [Pseudomonadota bacterium]
MNGKPLDVLFVMPNLSPGGAERVAVTLLANTDPARVSARLMLIDDRDAAWLDEIPPDVNVRSLGCKRLREGLFPLLRQIRTQAPDVVFSMQWHLNTMLAFVRPWLPTRTALVGRETSMPGLTIRNEPGGGLRSLLTRICYPRLDAIIVQGEAMRADLEALAPRTASGIRILHNPLQLARIRGNAAGSSPWRRDGRLEFIALGRLSPVKGLDRVISAFALAALPDARLTILGEGPLESELRTLAAGLGLGKRVHFQGFVPNPYPHLAAADAMLMASHHEGFPNSALEAMALGTPVLALPAPGGIAEALSASPACRIAAAPTPEALAALMAEFSYGDRARVAPNAVDHHEAGVIASRLADILEEACIARRAAIRPA